MPSVNDIPDTTSFWVGYPFKREPIPLNYTALLRERNKLAALHAKLIDLLHSDGTKVESAEHVIRGTLVIANEAVEWAQNLPPQLQQSDNMPSPIFELQ